MTELVGAVLAAVVVLVVVKALVWAGVVVKMSVEVLVIDVWSDTAVGTRAGVVVINAVDAEAIARDFTVTVS